MSEILWGIYKLFYDPPGTPKDLKCVNCKLAAGGLSLVTAAGGSIAGFKLFKKNMMIGSLIMCGSFCVASAGAVLLRMASEHHAYNQQLIANTTEQIRRERLSRRDAGKPIQQAS